MHYEDNGAYTGEIAASMLIEHGVEYVIIGHSERRQLLGEGRARQGHDRCSYRSSA